MRVIRHLVASSDLAPQRMPYTLTGKKMEVPVRKIVMGMPVEKAASRDVPDYIYQVEDMHKLKG